MFIEALISIEVVCQIIKIKKKIQKDKSKGPCEEVWGILSFVVQESNGLVNTVFFILFYEHINVHTHIHMHICALRK